VQEWEGHGPEVVGLRLCCCHGRTEAREGGLRFVFGSSYGRGDGDDFDLISVCSNLV
jgi:hypothetical protein